MTTIFQTSGQPRGPISVDPRTKLLLLLAGIFVVSHDYEFISAVCSRVVHFGGGTVRDDFPVKRESLKKLQDFFIPAKEG